MGNNFENKESNIGLPDVKLAIRDKEYDKNFMVTFESNDRSEVDSFNFAIEKVLSKYGFNPFHQIAGMHGDEMGYNGWEVWKNVDRKELEKLLPEIEEEALKNLKMYKKIK